MGPHMEDNPSKLLRRVKPLCSPSTVRARPSSSQFNRRGPQRAVAQESLRLWPSGVRELREALQGGARCLATHASGCGLSQWKTLSTMAIAVKSLATSLAMAGDASNPTWNSVRGKIDKAYRGGAQSKGGSYRRVGADIIEKFNAKDGRFREISQDFYAETCADFDIDASRSHQKDGAFALWPHCLVSPRCRWPRTRRRQSCSSRSCRRCRVGRRLS